MSVLFAVEEMQLEQVRNRLRAISGKPYKDETDRVNRMKLWRRLDELLRQKGED